MTGKEYLAWVLPLSVKKVKLGRKSMFSVRTVMGFTVGSRLLKGVIPPRIDSFGPFENEEEANDLVLRLTKHIEKDWPRRNRHKTKATRKKAGL